MQDEEYVMWADAGDVRVGEYRGEPGPEIRTETGTPCPFCSTSLFEITGYTERVIITELRGKPVRGKQLCVIKDIPPSYVILSCPQCRQNFTQERKR